MAQPPIRKLAAILAADAVGFTARMARDEDGALRAIRASIEMLEQVVGMHSGRVVKTLVDGLLAEFGSVVNAVSAAAAIQSRLAQRRRDLPQEAQFNFRIGVHVGDIVVEGEDIFGDGVNTAAKLEAEAPAGRTLVSDRVFDDVVGKLAIEFEEFGTFDLGGTGRARPVYAIVGKAPSAPPKDPDKPGKPSVAVLPFTNISSDPEQDYFADGLTEDIIISLASVPWLFVVARNSSFSYKGGGVDVRRVGRELGVRYVLEGSIRRASQRLRVTGQLVDTKTGNHIWAGRMDGALEDVFDLQDRVTDEVVAAIAPEIQAAEQQRVARKHPSNLTSYDQILRAMAAINRSQIGDAIECLDATIAMAPDYAKALAMRAWVHTLQIGWLADGQFALHRDSAIELARRALDMTTEDVEVVAHAAYASGFFAEEPDRSLVLLKATVERSPSFMWAWASLAMHHAHHHDPAEGVPAADEAIRLSPRDPMAFRAQLARTAALSFAGRWDDVAPAARAALSTNPNMIGSWVYLVCALAETGAVEQLDVARRELLNRYPEISVTRFRAHYGHFLNYIRQRESFEARMKAAGVPE